ncbi:unnamed protein product [Linum trigynum]|uniref:Uncharacterized protein n=1 Tax=Linum trigynum TaxID=586398 RepID=A0AAV2FMF9_9ROSI
MPSENKLAQIDASRTYHTWRIGSIDFIICGEKPRLDFVICSLQNQKKMAFRINGPKSVMVPLWNLPKIDPE